MVLAKVRIVMSRFLNLRAEEKLEEEFGYAHQVSKAGSEKLAVGIKSIQYLR